MNTSIIEQMDKSRYNLIKWFTIAWTIWFGSFILKDLINNMIILGAIILLGLIAWSLFFISLIRLKKMGKIMNSNNKLKNALSDELNINNRNKAFITGYWTLLILIAILFVITIFTPITALLVCEVTLYVGVLSSLISLLIYNR